MPEEGNNVGIAFALTIGAGLATALGASIVFFPRLVKYANRSTLACALGFSAGVMTYVSFIEIFQKSIKSFVESGYTFEMSYKLASLCLFGGVFLMIILNSAVTCLLHGHHHHDHHHIQTDFEEKKTTKDTETDRAGFNDNPSGTSCGGDSIGGSERKAKNRSGEEKQGDDGDHEEERGDGVSPCHCCSQDPVKDLERIQAMATELEKRDHNDIPHCTSSNGNGSEDIEQTPSPAENTVSSHDHKEQQKITRMSVNTAVAIALHNFPEGLATFVATLNDPKVGIVLAVAIAVHNIPEGICVALPVFYATGNRWKAFGWAVLSGVSEPIAAVLGWLVLASVFSPATYAVLFGIVAGMMIIISVRELLPTAHRYDPDDKVVTTSYIAGMVVMASSLVLFMF